MDPSERKHVQSASTRTLINKCTDSIKNNPQLKALFTKGDENTKRAILNAWREGYIASGYDENVPSQDAFLSESLSEVRDAVAA